MITQSGNTIKKVKQGDEKWMLEEGGAIFHVDLFQSHKEKEQVVARSRGRKIKAEEKQVPSHQDRKKLGGHVQGINVD